MKYRIWILHGYCVLTALMASFFFCAFWYNDSQKAFNYKVWELQNGNYWIRIELEELKNLNENNQKTFTEIENRLNHFNFLLGESYDQN